MHLSRKPQLHINHNFYIIHHIHSFLYSYSSRNLFYLGIGINPIGSSQLKLWHFMSTSQFTDYTRDSLYYSFFWGLNFIFDTISLYYFKYKVLRVLLKFESPNSEHRSSGYVQNNPDYSMSKAGTRIWLAHSPTLSEFLGHLEQEFDNDYSLSLVLLEVYFT